MENKADEKALIRRYLLGETTERETRGVEKRIMTAADFFDQVISEEEVLIEEYVQELMSQEVREKFERSFLATAEGKGQVEITKALLKYGQKKAEPKPVDILNARRKSIWSTASSNSYLRIAASALIFVGLAFGIYRMFFNQSDTDKGLAELQRIYKDRRSTETRIAEFNYAPWIEKRGDKEGPDGTESEYAERLFLDAVRDKPGAESHHGLGIFYLTQRRFDKAIAQFELSARYAPSNAKLHSDWGAALLESGLARVDEKGGKAVEDFSKSFEHLQKALELDPERLDALFNLALLYKAQGMADRAKETWEEYLKKEPDPKWADEAREKLNQLDEERHTSLLNKEELLNEFLQAYKRKDVEKAWQLLSCSKDPLSGISILEQLLDLYLDYSLNGKTPDAQDILTVLSFVGELELKRAKDTYSRTLASFYRTQPTDHLSRMKQARDLTKQGHIYYVEDQYARAIDVYTEAREVFGQLGNRAEAAMGDYWIAYCHTEIFDTKTASLLFEKLLRFCEANQFQWLRIRSLSGLGANYYIKNKHSEAARYYHSSLNMAEEIEDSISALNALDSLTELYRSIGNYPRSFECIQRGFPHTVRSPLNPNQRLRHYSIMASTLTSAGFWNAALEYQKESLRGEISNTLINAAVSYANLGALYAKQKKYDDANKSINLAYETANRVNDERIRDGLIAYSSLYLGHVYREFQDFDNAVTTYTDTIKRFSKLEIPVMLYQAHKGKLYCHVGSNNERLIEEELQTTLRILEENRLIILEGDNRNSFFDMEQNVYDIAIDYTYSRLHESERAFEFSEASRARSLLDMLKGTFVIKDSQSFPDIHFPQAFSPLKFEEIKKRLPDTAQVVQYSVLDEKIIVWVITNGDNTSFIIPIDRAELDADVKEYLRLISNPPASDYDTVKQLSERLFDTLIKPISLSLDSNKTIYIMPDKILSYLPFESLLSSVTDRYMLEDYNIAYSPSSSVFLICEEEARRKNSSSVENILSLGNPTFDKDTFSGLGDLRSAKREAERISRFYDGPTLLTGPEVKESFVTTEMEKFEVVHIAAHSILDEYSPMQSKILLTMGVNGTGSGSNGDGILEAKELYKLKLLRTRLVVLSSCQSGIDHYYKGEGMLSLARPFIAAGVPLVVASLWEVDSDTTADLMIDFHNYRKSEKRPTVEALTRARLKMMSRDSERFRHPYYWASFIAIGGHTEY